MSFVSEIAKRNPGGMMSCWNDNWKEENILIYQIKKFISRLSILIAVHWLRMEWRSHTSLLKLFLSGGCGFIWLLSYDWRKSRNNVYLQRPQLSPENQLRNILRVTPLTLGGAHSAPRAGLLGEGWKTLPRRSSSVPLSTHRCSAAERFCRWI